jgi:hypothetical protein
MHSVELRRLKGGGGGGGGQGRWVPLKKKNVKVLRGFLPTVFAEIFPDAFNAKFSLISIFFVAFN